MRSICRAVSIMCAIAASGFGMTGAQAQDYPSRPIRLIVGYAAGGINDQMARSIGEHMSKELGQQVIIENKPGAGTAVASTFVAQAEPDGYTVLFGTNSLAINPALSPKLTPKDPISELTPVGLALESPFYLLISKNLPIRTVKELVDYAKANPDKLNFGSSGNGSTSHLILELFNNRFETKITHVPYRGAAPTMVDLMAGRIDGAFATPVDATPALDSGAGIPIAVTSLEPLVTRPELPPIAATLPGFRGVFWTGLFVPLKTPETVVAKLTRALEGATRDPEIVAKARERGVTMLTGGPDALRDLLKAETASWSKLIKDANLRGE